MQKIIDMWFESEEIAVQFSQSKMYDVGSKIIKTIVLFMVCLIALAYLLVGMITSVVMDCLRGVKKEEKPPLPKTMPAETSYTETGLPEELGKKGEGMSENDYENLRKVL